jgi:hypothetical protein
MRHLLTWLVALLWAAPVSAQITLDAESLRLPVGTTYALEAISLVGTMAENGIDVGPAGANQAYDLSGPLGGQISLDMSVSAIPVSEAPDAELFPEADYALRSEMDLPDGTTQVAYSYMQRSGSGDVALGTSADPEGATTTVEPSPLPLPLHYGQSWTTPQVAVETELSPGVGMVGAIDVESEVDAWGVVTLPAGEYHYLRIHQISTGQMTYQGDPDLEALGPVTSTGESYAWNTRYLGGVASIGETTTIFSDPSIPPMTLTQIARLTHVEGPPSAVAAVSWGALKLLQQLQRPVPHPGLAAD